MDVIRFPGLWGLSFPIGRVAFKIFGIPVYWYGIIIALGFLLAVVLGMRRSKKEDIDPDNLIDMVLFATPAAIIGARLYYVIFSWSSFKNNLLDIFNTRKGGLAIYGGIIAAFIVGYIYCRVKKINFLKVFDFGAPYFVLAQGIGRWGNFVNQEAYGINTRLPWGMTSDSIQSDLTVLKNSGLNVDPSIPVHPTFLYESLWDIATFAFLIWFRKRKKLNGEVFFLYLVLYGIGRFFIEGLRTDSLMLGSLRISRALSALLVITFAVVFIVRRRKLNLLKEQEEIGESSYSEVLRELQEEEQANSQINSHETDGMESEIKELDEIRQEENSPEQEKSDEVEDGPEETP